MGLIDDTGAAPAPTAAPDAGGGDPISQTRAAVEQKVPPEQKDALQRIVLAGQKILYDKQTNTEVERRLQSSKNPAEAAGSGALELLGVLAHESRGTLPQPLVGPAAMILMTEILDYMKQTGRIKGTPEELETAARALSDTMMKGSGVSSEGFDQILNKASEAMNDPNIAAKMQQHMQGA